MDQFFYAYGNNGARFKILISTENTAAGEEKQVFRSPDGGEVVRLDKGKYQLLSEFFGDPLLTTDDPNAP